MELLQENSRNYLNEVLKQNASVPVRLQSLNLVGGGQFRHAFLARQLQPILQNDRLTLAEFLHNIDETKDNFLKTQSITNIGVQIDNSYFRTHAPRNGIDLVTNLEILPVKKFFAKVGTNVGNGEGDGYLTLQYKNIFGGAETVTFDTTIASNSLSTKNKSTYVLNMSAPVNNSPHWRLENIAMQSSKYVDFMCNHDQITRGLTHKLVSQHATLNHEFSVENVLRTVNLRGNNAFAINDDIMFQSGDDWKSALSYTLSYDTRDDAVLPTRGMFFKASSEYSVFSPFWKSQFELQTAQRLTSSQVANFSLRSGIVHNLASTPVHVMDRFYLGGPNDVRGFAMGGLGPKLARSPTGGTFFYGANLSVFQNLGKYDSFKAHAFVNAGRVGDVHQAPDLAALVRQPSVAAGVGLVYKHPIARFELNFVLPVAAAATDPTRKGLQYGIGISFM